jgi:hypothetical protein
MAFAHAPFTMARMSLFSFFIAAWYPNLRTTPFRSAFAFLFRSDVDIVLAPFCSSQITDFGCRVHISSVRPTLYFDVIACTLIIAWRLFLPSCVHSYLSAPRFGGSSPVLLFPMLTCFSVSQQTIEGCLTLIPYCNAVMSPIVLVSA